MAKGKDTITCTLMNSGWTFMPQNLVLQIIVGIYNIIFGLIKPLRKAINHILYYSAIILIILFKSIGLRFMAKTVRFIGDQFIIADTPWNKRMKNCKKFGKLGKKINVKKFKKQFSQGVGADNLERDENDVIEDENENENENKNKNNYEPSGRTSWGKPSGNISEISTDKKDGDKNMIYSMLCLGGVFLALYIYVRKDNEDKLNINQM